MMSKATTPASPAEDLILMYRSLVTSILSPPAVSSDVVPFGTLQEARAAPGTTWRSSTAVSASLSARRASKVSLGISAKASLVGANTVKGPSPESVSTRSAACTPTPTQTIAELAIATPQLSTLLAAVQAADLVETLSGEGPFTVFAPTNEAFAEIPKDTLDALLADKEALTAVLLRHVVPGAALASCNVPRGTTSLDTAGGESIEVTRDRYIKIKSSAGEAGVVAFDIMATNGVVHIVNSVF